MFFEKFDLRPPCLLITKIRAIFLNTFYPRPLIFIRIFTFTRYIPLQENVNIQSLDLEGNDFGPEGTHFLAEALSVNPYITELVSA